MFLLIVFIGFTLSVALTSLETRHFGNFLAPFLILLLIPNPEVRRDRREYRQWLITLLAIMGSVHLAWVAIKL
jgi:hypothetical protein